MPPQAGLCASSSTSGLGPEGDMAVLCGHVRFPHKRTSGGRSRHVRFSNRPIGVKRFQTIHRCSVDVAHGLALLFGIGTRALPPWDSRTRRNNLCHGLTVSVTAGSKRTCELTSSIVPRGTSFHRSVELEFPPIAFDP